MEFDERVDLLVVGPSTVAKNRFLSFLRHEGKACPDDDYNPSTASNIHDDVILQVTTNRGVVKVCAESPIYIPLCT